MESLEQKEFRKQILEIKNEVQPIVDELPNDDLTSFIYYVKLLDGFKDDKRKFMMTALVLAECENINTKSLNKAVKMFNI